MAVTRVQSLLLLVALCIQCLWAQTTIPNNATAIPVVPTTSPNVTTAPVTPAPVTPAPTQAPLISTACEASLFSFLSSPNDVYLAVMIDATGKSINDLGKYDQCRDLGVELSQYCLAHYQFPGISGAPMPFLGVCAPANCTSAEILKLVVAGLLHEKQNISKIIATQPGHLDSFECQPYNPPTISTNAGAVVFVIICSFLAAIVVAGTLLDGHYNNWWPEKPVSAETEPLIAGSIQGEVKHGSLTERRSKLARVLVCFSVVSNYRSLVGPSPPGGLNFLNGVRALSIAWVILGHTAVYQNNAGFINFAHVFTVDVSSWTLQAFPGAEFAVDTFFWLSGFLVAYLTLQQIAKKPIKGSFFFLYYFHRIWRVTPAYLFALFFYRNLSPFMANGPLWGQYVQHVQSTCGTNYWTNILYVNNFIPSVWENQCMLWGWYLAVDLQLYIFAIYLLIIYKKNRIAGWIVVIILTIACVAVNGAFAHHYNLKWNASDPSNYMNNVYGKPYTRATPYLLGIACAYLLHEKVKIKPIAVWIGYLISGFLIGAVVYGPSHQYERSVHGLSLGVNNWINNDNSWWYFTFSKFAFSLGISFVLWTFSLGYGGYLRRFLGASFWTVLARLTYSCYLFHPIIMYVVYNSTEQYFDYTVYKIACYYVAFLVLGFSAATIMFITLERPFVNLEKILMPSHGARAPVKKPSELPTTSSESHQYAHITEGKK